MKAAYIEHTGPPENIVYGDLPEPVVGELDVLVRVSAVTVDPIDTYIRSGEYPVSLPMPFIIGRDMTGVVVSAGARVTRFKPGDRVWCNNQGYGGRQGTFAELVSINQELLYPLPAGTDERESVAVVHSALTAVVGLFSKAGLKPGENIFINGGSGNVGTAVLQLAKATGARVAVTAGTNEKISWCQELGADLVINYKTDDIEETLRHFAPRGVDVYWDATKMPDVGRALPVMAPRARMLIMSGLKHNCTLPIGEFYTRNCTLYGFTITDRSIMELTEASHLINKFLANGRLRAKIHSILSLSRASDAHLMLEQDNLFGKVVLVPDS